MLGVTKGLLVSTTLAPPQTFGDHVACRRDDLGMSREDLGSKLGVTEQNVGLWERDVNLPRAALLPALAKALRVSTRTLGSWLDDSPLAVVDLRGYLSSALDMAA